MAEDAARDARLLQECGFTAVMIENFHDRPFRRGRVPPETIAAMAVVAHGVREAVDIPLGINVLRNDALGALAVACATGGSFLRVNVLSGTAVTDQGLVEGEADELLRRRAALGAGVAILADVDVKHATSLDRRPLADRARDLAGRAGADALLVTGPATGVAADTAELEQVVEAVAPMPVLAASGVRPESLRATWERCAGVIVGTALEDPATGRISPARVRDFQRACAR